MSPDRLQHFFDFMLGGLGRFGTDAFDTAQKPMSQRVILRMLTFLSGATSSLTPANTTISSGTTTTELTPSVTWRYGKTAIVLNADDW